MDNLKNLFTKSIGEIITHSIKKTEKTCEITMTPLKKSDLASIFKELSKKERSNVRSLVITQCKVKDLPSEVSLLDFIYDIDLSSNALSSLPKEFSKMDHLTKVVLSQNKMTNFSALTNLRNLTMLDISGNGLTEIPAEIAKIPKLEALTANDNNMTSFPSTVFGIANLKILELAGNEISEVGTDFRGLNVLANLDLAHNQIKKIHPQICHLRTTLKILKLNDNNLTRGSFPKEFGELEGMRELNLSENQIVSLPESFCKLKNLRKLFLDYNALSVLPEAFGELTNLHILMLNHNQLSDIPPRLALLKNLLRLSMEDNPLMAQQKQFVKDFGALAWVQTQGDVKDPNSKASNRKSVYRKSVANDEGSNRRASVKMAPPKMMPRNVAPPRWELFKNSFEQMVEEQDFSQRRRKLMANCAIEEKWNLIKIYKPNVYTSFASDSKENLNSPPSDSKVKSLFEDVLKHEPSPEVLSQLTLNLKKADLGLFFENPQILEKLVQYFSKYVERDNLTPSHDLQRLLYLRIIGAIVQNEVAVVTFLTIEHAVEQVVGTLYATSLKIKSQAVEVLYALTNSNFGTQLVLECLNKVEVDREKTKFFSLAQALISPAEKKVYLQLINAILLEIDDLEERMKFRNKLIQEGFLIQLEQIRSEMSSSHELIEQVDIFLDEFKEDNEEALMSPSAAKLLMVSHGQAPTENYAWVTQPGSIHQMCLGFSYDVDTTVDQLQLNVYKSFNLTDRQANNWGLYIKVPNEEQELIEYCLSDSPTSPLFELGIYGEIELEMKLRPWNFQAFHDKLLLQVPLDPNTPLHVAITTALTSFKIEEDSGSSWTYGFKVDPALAPSNYSNPDTNNNSSSDQNLSTSALALQTAPQWLEPHKQLKDYQFLKDTPVVLMLKPFHVQFIHRVNEQVLIDPYERIEDFVARAASEKTLPSQYYGLLLDQYQDYLDPNATFSAYPLTKQSTLKFVGQRREIYFQTADRQFFSVTLPITHRVFEFVAEACQAANISNPEKYHLRVEGEEKPLGTQAPLDSLPLDSIAAFLLEEGTSQGSTSMWEEENNAETIDMDTSGNIKSCTLNKLVECLTHESKMDPVRESTCFLTYRMFSTPEAFWKKLQERYATPSSLSPQQAQLVKMRVCVFCYQWTKACREDFSSQLKEEMSQFFMNVVAGECGQSLAQKQIAAFTEGEGRNTVVAQPPKAKVPKPLGAELTLMDIDPLEVARQMTLTLSELYRVLRPNEFFRKGWEKANSQQTSPNLLAMIQEFNRTSNMVALMLVQEPKVRQRAKLLERFIQIASHLRELGNFHSLMAIVGAINGVAVSRLKWTLAKLSNKSRERLTQLEGDMNMEGSFKTYRGLMNAATGPAIPYAAVSLTDLIFIEDGNPDWIGSRINWEKCKLVAGVLEKILAFTKQVYILEPVPAITQYLHAFQTKAMQVSEKELYNLSLKIEPRGANRNEIQ